MISVAWFLFGVMVGVAASLGSIMYLGNKEINKRKKRATDWQKAKKQIDKEIMDEYGV